jgi:hypothetical protein
MAEGRFLRKPDPEPPPTLQAMIPARACLRQSSVSVLCWIANWAEKHGTLTRFLLVESHVELHYKFCRILATFAQFQPLSFV